MAAAIILIVSAGLYANTLTNGFVYDDHIQIEENYLIKDISLIPEIFNAGILGYQSKVISNYYRPVMYMAYILNYHIFGVKPFGFHLTNIFFHAAASLLVFIILGRICVKLEPSADSSVLPAFIAALLFAAHTIHTEAVAWIAGLPDLSYTFFLLLSFYFYLRYEEGSRWVYHLFSAAAFFIATLCKEPALVFPAVLVSYDYVFNKEKFSRPNYFKRYIPYIALSGLYLLLRFNALGGFSPRGSNVSLSTFEYIINVFPLFAGYLEKLILPLDLNVFHVFRPISSFFEARGIISFAVSAGFMALVFSSFRKKRLLCFSLLLIALPVLPALYIPAVGEHVFAERYLYFPSFGFVMLIAFVLLRAKKAAPRFAAVLGLMCMLLTVAYAIGTVRRNMDWRDDLTLYADAIKKSPGASVPHYNLGYEYAKLGRTEEAIKEYIAALKIKPDYAEAHNNLGNEYEKLGRAEDAIGEYINAIKDNPGFVPAHYNLGSAYIKLGRTHEAAREFQEVLRLNPGDAMAAQFYEMLRAELKQQELIKRP